MPSGAETLLAQEWVLDRLESDPTLVALVTGIYPGSIPRGANPPAVVQWIRNPNSDVVGAGPFRILSRFEIVVEGVVAGVNGGDLEALVQIAQRIDARLHGVTAGSTSALLIHSSMRSEPWQPPEDTADDGTKTNRLGGIYELQVQAI